MLLNGWIAYRALSTNSGGPFLAGLSETVFCTSEAGYNSYGGYGSNISADGCQHCNSCLTVGIKNGAGEIGARPTTGRMMILRLSIITCIIVIAQTRPLQVCDLMTLNELEKAGW